MKVVAVRDIASRVRFEAKVFLANLAEDTSTLFSTRAVVILCLVLAPGISCVARRDPAWLHSGSPKWSK